MTKTKHNSLLSVIVFDDINSETLIGKKSKINFDNVISISPYTLSAKNFSQEIRAKLVLRTNSVFATIDHIVYTNTSYGAMMYAHAFYISCNSMGIPMCLN